MLIPPFCLASENFHALPTLLIPIAGREEHIKKHKQVGGWGV